RVIPHPALAASIANGTADRARRLVVGERAIEPARRLRDVTERRERVRLEPPLARVAVHRERFLERRPRLLVALETTERHADAVQREPFVDAIADLAHQLERSLVVRQRLAVRPALPLQDAERVAQRRLASRVAESGRQRKRLLESADRVRRRRRGAPGRARDSLERGELALRVAGRSRELVQAAPLSHRVGAAALLEDERRAAPHQRFGVAILELLEQLSGLENVR